VITQNDITRSGISGIDEILSTELFSGFFGRQKNLVAGGRYRPLSVITFAVEWDLFGYGRSLNEYSHDLVDDSFDRLRKANVPQNIINSLTEIKNKNFETDDQFEKAVVSAVGEDNATRYLDTIVSASNRAFGQPYISHFINVLLFALTCILLFRILERLLAMYAQNKWFLSVPFIATLLYVVHPLHTEVVSNIKGRDEIFTLLGALLTLWFSLRFLDKRKPVYLLCTFVIYFLALISKENAITFFAVIPLSIWFFTNHSLKRNLITLIPMIAATIIFFIIRQGILGWSSPGNIPKELMNDSFLYHTPAEKYASITYTLGYYIRLLFFPYPLTYDYYPYQIPILNWGNLWVLLSLLLNLALAVFTVARFRRKEVIVYGILFYAATFSIVTNILFPIGTLASERFMFIPSIGFCLILAWLFVVLIPSLIKNKKICRVLLIGLSLVFLVFYSCRTISRNTTWQNDYTLFTDDVLVSGNSAKSNTSAGGKMIEEAELLKKIADRDFPGMWELDYALYSETNLRESEIQELMNAGSVEEVKKKIAEKNEQLFTQAIAYLEKAIRIHPSYTDPLLLLGNAHFQYDKNVEETIKYYKIILKGNPYYDKVFTNLEIIMSNFEDIKKKIAIYEEFHAINPDRYEVNYRLGLLYGETKIDVDKALDYLEQAIAVKPKSFEALKALGAGYGEKGEYEKSIAYSERAMQIKPDDEQLKTNLGITYNLSGVKEFNERKNFTKAIEYFERASQFFPGDANILFNIGQCYFQLGNQPKAQEYFAKVKQMHAAGQ
ncbi:MAG: tetratricopeptide repeat protein, partial [Bacteroidetes bacterium]|nr:tetratricopeptide repeat protein [Bacteroidota bacterium]